MPNSYRYNNSIQHALEALRTALDHDDCRRYQQAQTHYIVMLERSVHFLKMSHQQQQQQQQHTGQWATTTPSPPPPPPPPHDIEHTLLKYMKESIDRIEHIRYNNSSNSSISSHIVMTGQQQQQQQQQQCSHGHPPPLSPPSLTSLIASPPYASTSSLSSSTIVREGSGVDLQRVRRQHEEQQLQRMREQMRQQLATQQKERTVSQFRDSIRARHRKFRWRSRDRWTRFIDSHFKYEQMHPELLLADKQWMETLQDMMHNATAATATTTAASNPYPHCPTPTVADVAQCITRHMRSVLDIESSSSPSSPSLETPGKHHQEEQQQHMLATVVSMYAHEFCKSYAAREASTHAPAADRDPRTVAANALMDIAAFTDKLLSVLLMKYWHCDVLDSDLGEEAVMQEITRSIYSQGVHDLLLSLFDCIDEVGSSNRALLSKCREFNAHGVTMRHLGIAKRYRLDDSVHTYAHIVHDLRGLESELTLEDKCAVLSRCVSMISDTVQNYWHDKGGDHYTQEQLLITSDDLLPIFAFIFIRAELTHPVSHLSMMGELLDDFKSESAFALATADTAWKYVLALDWDVLEQQFEQTV